MRNVDLVMLEQDSATGRTGGPRARVGAFFDVDNTLHPGFSIEERFFFHLLTLGLVTAGDFLRSLLFLLKHVPPISRQPLREHKVYLNGKPSSVIQPAAQAFVERVIVPRVSPDALTVLEEHRRLGHRLVLVTASLDFLVTPLASWLRVDELLAARAEVQDGLYTGRLLPPFPYGEGKKTVVMQYARDQDVELERSYFYGDSPGDRQVLGVVGHPRVVNPIRGMARIAKRKGWPIVRWT